MTALIGTRLEPQLAAAQVTAPYVVYTIISDPPSHRMLSDKDAWARVQYDCWGRTPAEARAVAAVVVACFDHWPPADYAGVPVRGSICDDRGHDTGFDDITGLYGHQAEMRVMHGVNLIVSVAATGTVLESITEADIVAGGKTLVLTVTNDTWLPAGTAFNAIRQSILNSIGSAQSEPMGWNSAVFPVLAVTDVVRTSDTVITITLPPVGSYNISATEEISAAMPAGVLVLTTGIKSVTRLPPAPPPPTTFTIGVA